MTTAFIALGSNLSAPLAQLQEAFEALNGLAFSRVRRISGVYRTPALTLHRQTPQPDYLNAVLELHTELSADALLRECQAIEQAQGRERDPRDPYAARTLDVDLLLFGNVRMNSVDLTLPHPRMHLRAFVLVPLLAIAPEALIPGRGKASDFLATLDASEILLIKDAPWATSTPT
jgi:2-amino-4-hydroxy-6-hydroxymethyldihydropteridine diphosphokinase